MGADPRPPAGGGRCRPRGRRRRRSPGAPTSPCSPCRSSVRRCGARCIVRRGLRRWAWRSTRRRCSKVSGRRARATVRTGVGRVERRRRHRRRRHHDVAVHRPTVRHAHRSLRRRRPRGRGPGARRAVGPPRGHAAPCRVHLGVRRLPHRGERRVDRRHHAPAQRRVRRRRRGAGAVGPGRPAPGSTSGSGERAGGGAAVPHRRPAAADQLEGVLADRRVACDVDVGRSRHPRPAAARHRGRSRGQ